MRDPTQEELLAARRVWRLAVLMTGDLNAARRVLDLVPPPHPGEPLDADRLDRLAIQAIRRVVGPSRRVRPGADGANDPGAPRPTPHEPLSLGPAHDLVTAMPLQAAEVWVLRRVDDLDPIRACRAMDCSRSAAERFLDQADAQIARTLGDAAPAAVQRVRRDADALIPADPVVHACVARVRARVRRRIAIIVAGVALGLGAIFAAASTL